MRNPLNSTTIPLLMLAFPLAAHANITGTPTLAANTTLSLDTGATSSSGGDILWSGSTMTPQGKATAYNAGSSLAAEFSSLTQAILSEFPSSLYSQSPIPAATLAVNDVFVVNTNGGNSAAVLVTAVSGTSISLQFITFGASSPTITAIQNNYSLLPPGFSNSGIAQGALFDVVGMGLADPSAPAVLQSSSGSGLPTTLNGASVKVTVNGTTTTPAFYYAIAGALGLVLPSGTPTGTGQITVTYNGQTSAPFPILVVSSAMGFDAYYGTGNGLGVATNAATGALYNYGNAIPPGTTVTLWGSGLGADPARDTTYVPAAFTIGGLAHVYIGGIDAPILYQGASGYPGLNQVNVTIPASAPTGCYISLVGVTAAGAPTNFTTLPIGNGPCSDPVFGASGGTLQSLSGQTTVKVGGLLLAESTAPATSGSGTTVTDAAIASFESYTGAAYVAGGTSVSIGGCYVSESLTASTTSGTTTGLDAGAITVTNPAGSSGTLMSEGSLLPGFYVGQLATGFIPASGGTFSFKGAGGANVGAFSASVVFTSPVLTWTNQTAAATVTRSAGLPIAWTGGASGTYVLISGTSSSGGSAFGGFTCVAETSAGSFNVPGYVLAVMPEGTGSLTVTNETTPQSFTATGLDYGYAAGYVSYSINAVYK